MATLETTWTRSATLPAVVAPVLAVVFAITNVANTALRLAQGGPGGLHDADRTPDSSRRA